MGNGTWNSVMSWGGSCGTLLRCESYKGVESQIRSPAQPRTQNKHLWQRLPCCATQWTWAGREVLISATSGWELITQKKLSPQEITTMKDPPIAGVYHPLSAGTRSARTVQLAHSASERACNLLLCSLKIALVSCIPLFALPRARPKLWDRW